jgi:hypothetical protein
LRKNHCGSSECRHLDFGLGGWHPVPGFECSRLYLRHLQTHSFGNRVASLSAPLEAPKLRASRDAKRGVSKAAAEAQEYVPGTMESATCPKRQSLRF